MTLPLQLATCKACQARFLHLGPSYCWALKTDIKTGAYEATDGLATCSWYPRLTVSGTG